MILFPSILKFDFRNLDQKLDIVSVKTVILTHKCQINLLRFCWKASLCKNDINEKDGRQNSENRAHGVCNLSISDTAVCRSIILDKLER